MARKRKRVSNTLPGSARALQMRDALSIARPRRDLLHGRTRVAGVLHNIIKQSRLQIEDLRTNRSDYESLGIQRTYRRNDGGRARIIYGTPRQNPVRTLPAQLRREFLHPKQTLVCQRRQARRRVLHALRKTGKNGRGNRRARWSAASYVACR